MIHYEDVKKAHERIRPYVYRTPLDQSMYLSNQDTKVYLKLENQQKMKCAKARGAFSKITSLSQDEINKGIVAISSGNHGAAISYASKLMGIEKATVYVPETTPNSKVEKIEFYGAEVVKVGKNYDEAHAIGVERIQAHGGIFVDPCSDEVVIAGQGSIGLEILEEEPSIDTILVPIGGGGIITGISIAAKAVNPNIKIIGVQTAACPAMVAAMADEKFYEVYPTEDSICDALVGGVGYIPYQMSKRCIDDIIVVEETDIYDAIQHLLTKEKVVAEPAGAVGVAAIKKRGDLFKGRNVAVVITGGNMDEALMKEIMSRA